MTFLNDSEVRKFVAIADQGSLAGAARELRLTPSAVSRALERWHSIENFEERLWQDAFIDPEVLAYMRDKAGRP